MSRKATTSHFHKSKTLDNRYMLGDEIGKGAYRRVYKGLDLDIGDFVDVKQVSLENIAQEDLNVIMDEHPPISDNLSPGITDFLCQCFKKLRKMLGRGQMLKRGLLHPWIHNSRRALQSSLRHSGTLRFSNESTVYGDDFGGELNISRFSLEISMRTWQVGGTTKDTWEEVDPDEMAYEELLALGEAGGTQSRGLSSDTIATLPSISYKAQDNQDGNDDLCVICHLEYEEGETLTVLSCKHSYHSECISNWLQINKGTAYAQAGQQVEKEEVMCLSY